MDTVDSTIGPEVEQYDMSAKLGQSKRATARVKPVEAMREFGGANTRYIRDWL